MPGLGVKTHECFYCLKALDTEGIRIMKLTQIELNFFGRLFQNDQMLKKQRGSY